MSDKQLTVAELLARRAQETGEEAPRRRRRRRSLEEGGVSVAELTGSIPAVEDKPEQPRHSSQPIDEENDARVAAGKYTISSDSLEATRQPDSAPEQRAEASGSDDATMVLDVVHDSEQSRFTTESFPEQRPSQMEAAQGESVYGYSFDYSEPEPEHVEDAERERPAEFEFTPYPESHFYGESAAEQYPRPETSSLTERPTGQIEVIPDEPETVSVEDEPSDAVEAEDEGEEERSLSIPAIIGMALVAVVIGAAIFKGFEILWGRLDSIIVSVLAIAMTGGIVGVVHAMRTDRDKLTMALAVVVGLILTFGPRLIVGL